MTASRKVKAYEEVLTAIADNEWLESYSPEVDGPSIAGSYKTDLARAVLERFAAEQDAPKLVERIELAVWKELGARRWFGKHVDDDEIQELEADLKAGIGAALSSTEGAQDD